jgi:hypothetical protein
MINVIALLQKEDIENVITSLLASFYCVKTLSELRLPGHSAGVGIWKQVHAFTCSYGLLYLLANR